MIQWKRRVIYDRFKIWSMPTRKRKEKQPILMRDDVTRRVNALGSDSVSGRRLLLTSSRPRPYSRVAPGDNGHGRRANGGYARQRNSASQDGSCSLGFDYADIMDAYLWYICLMLRRIKATSRPPSCRHGCCIMLCPVLPCRHSTWYLPAAPCQVVRRHDWRAW